MGAGGVLLHVGLLGLYGFVSFLMQVGTKHNPHAREHKSIEILGKYSARYMTNWTFTVQLIYFFISVVGFILGAVSLRLKQKIHNVSDYMFTSIAAPMAWVVSLVFWGLYAIDRELVFPKELDLVLSPWINHTIHTINSLCTLVDIALINHRKPKLIHSVYGILTYLTAYSVCLFGTYFESGIWLYPFLKHLSWPMRGVFAAGTIVLALLMLAITRSLHSLVWDGTSGGGEKKKKATQKKKK